MHLRTLEGKSSLLALQVVPANGILEKGNGKPREWAIGAYTSISLSHLRNAIQRRSSSNVRSATRECHGAAIGSGEEALREQKVNVEFKSMDEVPEALAKRIAEIKNLKAEGKW